MIVLQVYTKCIKTKYKVFLLSKGTLVYVLTTFLSIVLPFVFAYTSEGFWRKQNVFYETPDVKFTGKYLFQALTNISSPIMCSSYSKYSDINFLSNDIVCPEITVHEVDKNDDLINEEIQVGLKINLPENCKINFFTFIIPLDFKLHTPSCTLQMESAVILQSEINFKTSSLKIIGDLSVFQTAPLSCSSKFINNIYNYSIVENEDNLISYEYKKILYRYLSRNITTKLINKYKIFDDLNSNSLWINIVIKLGENKFYSTTGFWHILKMAWIQYYSIYIIIYFFAKKFKRYIFDNRLVLYYKDDPLNPK